MTAKTLEISDLNRIYNQAEECDKELFAEQRSNILLIAGEHYQKINARIANTVRQSNKPSAGSEQKLRLTKNHMHRVHRGYKTAILSGAPGTAVFPKNETEEHDKKDAEMNQAVWLDTQDRYELKDRRDKWCDQFVGIGEVCVKIFWDYSAGEFQGYEPLVDEATGEPVTEPTDQMQQVQDQVTGEVSIQPVMRPVDDKEKPIFTGGLVFEDVYGFNLLRETGTQHAHEHGRAWIVRKMTDLSEFRRAMSDQPEILSKLTEEQNETFVIFDAQKGGYEKRKDQCMVREFYWEPCDQYPEGWFVYATKNVKIAEGPLPEGIWPLVFRAFDEYSTSARGRSIIKVARPYQAEINRASSAMAVAQVTLGDDKLLYQAGSKLAQGALLPGVRGIAYQGQTPTVLSGRNGAQYLDYIQAQIAELERVVMIDDEDAPTGQIDPFTLLFRSAKQRKKYSPYIDKFSSFLKDVNFTALEILRKYMPDDMLITAVGRREMVNIPEFKSSSPLNHDIRVEEQDDTLETTFGRQLTFQHILQYVGKDLDKRTIGKILKNLPYANYKDDFDDLTLDEDIAQNDILALERGEQVTAVKYVDAAFMQKKLAKRQKEPDFKYLAPQIQKNYATLTQQYDAIEADQVAKEQAAKNEFIPVDGALVTCDFYVPPKNPEEQAKRAKIPQRALEWLLDRLLSQGMTVDKLEGMNAQNLADMAEMLLRKNAQGQGAMPP